VLEKHFGNIALQGFDRLSATEFCSIAVDITYSDVASQNETALTLRVQKLSRNTDCRMLVAAQLSDTANHGRYPNIS